MGEKMKLPPGFRFCPNDEELISFYLKPKILGQNCNIINTIELYGPNSTPWQLFDVNDADSWIDTHNNLSEKIVYVFTSLSKLRNPDSKKATTTRNNTCKKAGCGTWGGKTKKCQIRDCEGNVIGEKRLLVFEINDTCEARFDRSKAGYFKMHEYSLSGVNKGLKSAADLVLCKITYDSSKEPVFKLPCKSSDDHGLKNTCDKQKNKNGQIEGSVLEEIGTLISKSVVEMNRDNTGGTECLTSDKLLEEDNGLSYFDDFLAAPDEGFLEANEFAGDPGFDVDWLAELLNSNEDECQVEDSSSLGKRKFQEESLHGNKRICL